MADYITPEERVASRKKVFNDYLNFDPMQESQQKAERDELTRQTMAATGAQGSQMSRSPQLQGLGSLGIIQQAAGQGMQMLGAQATARDQTALQGATMQQGIAGAKSEQAVGNVSRGLENNTQRLARAVADKAFAEGMEAKQLIFHENSALADYSLERLKVDFESGRVSQRELLKLQQDLESRAVQRKYAADEAIQKAQGEFETEIKRGNIAGAKARMSALLAEQKAALKDAVRAKAIADMTAGLGSSVSAAISSFG